LRLMSYMETNSDYPEKLAKLYQSIENYTRILAESMLYDLRVAVDMRILAADKYACLDARDEKIYDSYLHLIRHYKRILALYQEKAELLVTPSLKNMIQGIEAVIRARLLLCPAEITDELAQNPIFLEKKRIPREYGLRPQLNWWE